MDLKVAFQNLRSLRTEVSKTHIFDVKFNVGHLPLRSCSLPHMPAHIQAAPGTNVMQFVHHRPTVLKKFWPP